MHDAPSHVEVVFFGGGKGEFTLRYSLRKNIMRIDHSGSFQSS